MKDKEQQTTWKDERSNKSNNTINNPKYPSHSHSPIPGTGDMKRRYHVRATRLPHIGIPSSPLSLNVQQGMSWDDWHDQAWKQTSQPHHDSRDWMGFRSLQEHKDNDSHNHTVPSSLPMFVRLYDEDTIRRSLVELSSITVQGKIYYPRPAKKNKHGKTHSAPTTPSGSVVIPLPDLMDPPPKWKLGQEVSTLEQDFPFGGALPKLQAGKEVNLRVKKSFEYANRKNRKDPFRNHLNWATTDNPDQVPLVHDPIDQGACGSCWAYVTTGSLETSLARRVAQAVYWQQLNHSTTTRGNDTNDDTSNATTTNNSTNRNASQRATRSAAVMAQWVESLAFNQTRLSIQELLDCDTQIDQGCIGGNPLLAFFYIHKYGLMSWDRYPYSGTRLDTCARSDRRDMSQYHFPTTTTNKDARAAPTPSSFPLATVDSWGILPKNHEDIIQMALRYIGPVAVAINGGDDDFIRYSGGIFDKQSCSQEANHAVLIVGYGQEEIEHKDRSIEIIRYWIARNSWGPLWGENGYIRIARGSGKKKVPGICGIARSPSVALGGRLLFSPWWGSEVADSSNSSTTINGDGDDPGDGWWLDWNGGRGDGGSNDLDGTSSGTDPDMYQDFVNNEWSHFCNAITPLDTQWHVGCRRIIHVFDNHRAASLGVLSLLVLLLLAFLLTYPCRVRQERRKLLLRQRQRLQQQQEQEQHNRGDTTEGDDEEGQDPSGHGSLSLSSDEDGTGTGQFAILEDDLVEEDTNDTENVPLLRTQGSAPQQQYGSVVVDNGGEDNSGSQHEANSNKSKNDKPPSKESNEMASSLFSTSSGRSWFFLQR